MAKQYKKILVPVDGTPSSYDAVNEAEMIAGWSDAEIILLTVKEQAHLYGLVGSSVGIGEDSAVDQVAQEILLKAASQIPKNVKYTTETLSGSPKREIVHYAKRHGIDLIVMGSASAGIINDLAIGSTTHYVVNHAPCRVTLIP